MRAKQITDIPIEEAYEHLAKSIVIQAIEDYRKILHNPRVNNYQRVRGNKLALESFFRSDWCYLLSGYNGEYLIEIIQEQEGIIHD